MANSLNRELKGCEVVIAREYYKDADDPKWDDEQNRTVLVTGGFGSHASTNGSTLFVRDRWGKSWGAKGYQVERFVREVPEEERHIRFIVNVMSPEGVQSYEVMAETSTTATNKIINDLGWGSLPHRIDPSHDDTLIEIEGVEYIVSPKMKGL